MPHVDATDLKVFGYRGISTENPFGFLHNGFSAKRDPVTGDPAHMYYLSKVDEGPNARAGDMHSGSANCVSSNLKSAALFPNDVRVKECWIYGVYVDKGFNTYEQQQMDAWHALSHERAGVFGTEAMSLVTWPLFAEEFATDSIPAKHVVACVKCTRTWTSTDWKDGGTFTLKKPIFWNVRTDPALHDRIEAFKERFTASVEEVDVGLLPITPG
ncbi:hypothetical protein [Microbulbifer sp. PAAF003]|uniref:hypothetical protein n=1 Tax=Microbulbifer sp. PAAF003 TaxID=3243375 RepID=UPI0040390668